MQQMALLALLAILVLLVMQVMLEQTALVDPAELVD
jgi:hypothetical protein